MVLFPCLYVARAYPFFPWTPCCHSSTCRTNAGYGTQDHLFSDFFSHRSYRMGLFSTESTVSQTGLDEGLIGLTGSVGLGSVRIGVH